MATLKDITFDCGRAPALARFWASMLEGYEVRPYDEAEIERLAISTCTLSTASANEFCVLAPG